MRTLLVAAMLSVALAGAATSAQSHKRTHNPRDTSCGYQTRSGRSSTWVSVRRG